MKESEQRDRFLVDEMLRHLAVIEANVRGGKERLESDSTARYAVEHATELLAEAAEKVRSSFKGANPSVPWKGLRDVRRGIAHPYDTGARRTAIDELWRFARDEAPQIARHLRRAKFPREADPHRA